jgi:ribosomal protein L39E
MHDRLRDMVCLRASLISSVQRKGSVLLLSKRFPRQMVRIELSLYVASAQRVYDVIYYNQWGLGSSIYFSTLCKLKAETRVPVWVLVKVLLGLQMAAFRERWRGRKRKEGGKKGEKEREGVRKRGYCLASL